MSVKKTKGKSKGKAKKSAKKSARSTKKPVDMVRVRENINDLVGHSAKAIANKVIEVARTTGQLASAKYLFEAVGLYPPTEETMPTQKEDSLAHTLLRRMGLPTEPLTEDEDPEPVFSISEAKRPVRVGAESEEKELGSEADEQPCADLSEE